MQVYDVIIIGAGTAGSYAAGLLAARGHSVCVLEKQATPGNKLSCTGIVSRDCLELLGAESGIIQFEARSARVHAPSGKCLRVERDSVQAYILDRPGLDCMLVRRARQAGAEYRFSAEVSSLRCEGNGMLASGEQDGAPLSCRARCAVIACGTSARLTGAAGLGRISEFAHGAQALVECPGLQEVEVYSGRSLAPGFFAWLAPVGSGQAKAGLLSSSNAGNHLSAFLQGLQQQGRVRPGQYDTACGSIPLRPLPRTYSDRLLVIGDAAGQAKPTTGGGIYFGALCSKLAAETLDTCLKEDDLSAKKLASYQRRWHRLLKNELAIDYWAHRFYQKLDDRQVEHIFNIIARHGIHETLLASPDISFDWHSKVILDAIRHRSLQRSLEKLGKLLPGQPAD
jgi:geranylgeranyl reductase family protein